MAKSDILATDAKVRLLRSLAFHIHRKVPAEEAMREFVDEQLKQGRRKEYRPAADALGAEGFLAAVRTLALLGDEALALLAVVVEAKDHRLLAAALNALADHLEE